MSMMTLGERLHAELVLRGQTVACAESLTGGAVALALSAPPGASESFVGGVVSYATSVKVDVLGVPTGLVEAHGVVSERCAEAMADGVRRLLGTDWAVSTTGVAANSESGSGNINCSRRAVIFPDCLSLTIRSIVYSPAASCRSCR